MNLITRLQTSMANAPLAAILPQAMRLPCTALLAALGICGSAAKCEQLALVRAPWTIAGNGQTQTGTHAHVNGEAHFDVPNWDTDEVQRGMVKFDLGANPAVAGTAMLAFNLAEVSRDAGFVDSQFLIVAYAANANTTNDVADYHAPALMTVATVSTSATVAGTQSIEVKDALNYARANGIRYVGFRFQAVTGLYATTKVSKRATAFSLNAYPVGEDWVQRYNGPANLNDYASATAVDAAGDVIVTGQSTNAGGNADYYTAKYAAEDGALLWEKRYNGTANGSDQALALALDGAGNVIVTGLSLNAAGNVDIYTAKYAAGDGTLLWEKRYNGPANGSDVGYDLAVDSAGNVVVTGFSHGNISGNDDYYTAKYAAADGTLVWEKRYNGPVGGVDYGYSVAVDAAGDVVVTGRSFGTDLDYYTAKYLAADGTLVWEKRYNGPGNGGDEPFDVAVDAAGNVVVTGVSNNVGANPDYYSAKYAAANGALVWEVRYNGPANGYDAAHSLAVDASGNVAVTGLSVGIGSSNDFYTAKYAAANGALIWEKRGPTNASDQATDLRMDAEGNVAVTGQSSNGSNHDYYTAKYAAADGALLWEQRYNGPANADDVMVAVTPEGGKLALTPDGGAVVTGASSNGTNYDYATVKYGPADSITLAPTLIAPAANTRYTNPVPVSFTLPEAALPGSLKLTFDNSIRQRIYTLDDALGTAGAHSFTFNASDPIAAAEIISGVAVPDGSAASIPDGGSYTVTLAYQDALGNPAASAVSTFVGIDTVTETPALWTLKVDEIEGHPSYVARQMSLSYTLYENTPGAGSLKLLFDNGSSVIEWTMSTARSTAQTYHTPFVLDPKDPTATGDVVSGAPVPDGTYTVRLSFQDALGNAAALSNAKTMVEDTVAPETSISTAPPLVSSSATAMFTFGSNESPVNWEATLDGGTPAFVGGSASYSSLPDGPHTLSVRARDAAGNFDPSPATHAWTVDASGPAGGTFAISPPSPVFAGTTFTGTFSGWSDAQPPLTYGVYAGSGPEVTIVVPGSNAAPTFTLPVGTHTVRGRIFDSLGNATVTGDATVVVNGVVNGDFNAGNTGFTSGFTYVAGTSTLPGRYSIKTNPQQFNPALASFGDHTTGSGSMIVADGAVGTIWESIIGVTKGTWYRFSAWAASTSAGNPSKLELSVGTTPLGPAKTLPAATGQWVEIVGYWYAGVDTSIAMRIRSTNANTSDRNDFALDDIDVRPITVPTDPGLLDTTVPTVAITAPTAGTVTGDFAITGTVKENFLLASLTVSLNGEVLPLSAPLNFAPNATVPWSVTGVAPENGPNVIFVEAIDTSGNRKSATKTVNYVNNRPGLAGSFSALLQPTGTPTHDTVGLVAATVTATGTFTGKVTIGGVAIPFSGVLSNAGEARFKPALGTSFDLIDKTEFDSYLGALTLTVSNPEGMGVGLFTAAGGSLLAEGLAETPAYSAANPVPQGLLNLPATGTRTKGVYTLAFPSKAQSPAMAHALYPQGDGFATLTLSNTGNVSLSGYLPDGARYTAAGKLDGGHFVQLYTQLYRKEGSMSGVLRFSALTNADVDGTGWIWLRPVRNRARYYPAGWPNSVRIDPVGAKYSNPASLDFGQGAADIVNGNASLVFSDGLLSLPVTKAVSVNPGPVSAGQVKLIPATGALYKLSLAAGTGAFSGTFTHDGVTESYRGILLNKGANKGGFGYFLSTPPLIYGTGGQSGGVSIEP
ncbi:MAG: REJ domain-containing protein [Chthoniobacteraceae bacterium]